MSDTPERLAAALRGIGRCAREGPTGGARVLGAHLEGPWLALERAGAQDRERLHPPHSTEVEALLEADPGVLRMVTLAPELDGGLDAVRRLSAAGVLVSLGHSAADYDEARAAFDAGASHVTHIFDAMPAIRHRRPGPVVAALADSRVTVEVIADGVHVHPAMLALVARGAAGGIVAVTDAVAAAGLPSGRYRLGRSSVDVADDRVVLTDAPDTLAGSVLTMDRAVATLVAAGLSLPDAVTAATVRPASAMGDASRGRIAIGAAADLVVLEPDLSCAATVVGGRVVHDPSGIFAGRGSTHAQDEHSPAEIAAAIPQV
jgi:N-acetylglucosamine-6-phosphate deacetylase